MAGISDEKEIFVIVVVANRGQWFFVQITGTKRNKMIDISKLLTR